MKQMKFTIYAIAALLLMGCAQVEESAEPKGSGAQSSDVVGFDVYTQRATRSGTTGDVTTDNLKTGIHSAAGFGVFAYNTGEGNYSSDFTPNFMYNQQVKYSSSAFTYEPQKYWPNEESHHVSFFAYAPWVDVTASTGAAADQTYGITGMTKNKATGAPLIHYVATTDLSKGVDLCWDQQLNKQKPNDDSKVEFTLKHALSKLNVKVQTSVDVNENTKIYIRSITFSGFTMKGSLNLNSATAQWTGYEKGDRLNKDAVTFYDGRRDGREGYVADDSEQPAGLNPDLVQSTLWNDVSPMTGVTNVARNLFSSSTAAESAYVIPTGDPVDITIEYDIETADPKLKGYFLSDGKTNGTSIANRITKTGVLTSLEAGKSYTINLNLGLTDVTFEATSVNEWSLSGGTTVSTTIIDLSTVTTNTTIPDGFTITGTLGSNVKISIAAGATVTLSNATINITGYENFAGINCLGDATIVLADGTTNTIGGPYYYPCIHIPDGYTITIRGTGTLNANSSGRGAGIGGGYSLACGNILIKSGIINASSNSYGAGIGGSQEASCGDIEIQGGTVTATGGGGAGIGSGYEGSCGNILISGGTVTASGGSSGAGIGSSYSNSSCGNIEIQGGTVTATGGNNSAGIGTGCGSDGGSSYAAKPTTCGTITISGGTVDATGGFKGAGIGTGLVGNCGNVTITSGVTQVTATKGSSAQHSIGRGNDGSHFTPVPFTVTIGGVTGAISTSPYTYEP